MTCTPYNQGEDCILRRFFPQSRYVAPKRGTGGDLFVAEAPGQEEDSQGEPLVGGSGRVFDALCRQAGLRREELTLHNVLPVRPPDNVFPTDSAARSYISAADAEACIAHSVEFHLAPLVNERPWARIIAMGEKSLRYLTGRTEGIFQWRGSPLPLVTGGKPVVIPTLHPAYVMRDQTMMPVFVNDIKKSVTVPPEHYNITPSLADVEAFDAREFAFDLETNPATKQILMVGLSSRVFEAMVVPFNGAYLPQIKRIFAGATRLFGQNICQFDFPILAANGVKPPPECEEIDTMLAQHLLFPDFPHDLEFIASQFTNKPAWKWEGRGQPGYWELRNARDTDVTLQIGRTLLPMLKKEGLWDLYRDVQVPLARICHAMTEKGFKTDSARLGVLREKYLVDIKAGELGLPEHLRTHSISVRKRVPAPAGTLGKSGKPVKFIHEDATKEVCPWRSDETLANWLYEECKLPVQLHIKTKKPTTDKTALDKLNRIAAREPNKYPGLAVQLGAYRKIKKLSTLLSGFLQTERGEVARVSARFNVHGTNSGRLSSSDPNLQNQPESARYIYVPSHPDWCLGQFDYSQGENRLTALFANDTERLARLAQPGFSEHKYHAAEFFGIPYEEVVHDNDKDAPYGKSKRVGHGLNYRMGAQKIANLYGLDLREVRQLVDKWKLVNAPTVEWQTRTASQAEQDGVLCNPFGRKRWFWTHSIGTESVSFTPQSALADIIFRAMIGLMYERIHWPMARALKVAQIVEPLPWPAQLLVQVHDSLVFEFPLALREDVVRVVKRVMEQPWPELGGASIPVDVEIGVPGASWGELEPYHV